MSGTGSPGGGAAGEGHPRIERTKSILVADNSMTIRTVIAQVIEDIPELEIAALASDGNEALGLIEETQPDIVILEIHMPRVNGIEVTRQLKEQWPEMKVIVFTSATDEATITEVFDAGADAYISKNDSWTQLLACVQALSADQKWISLPDSEHRLQR